MFIIINYVKIISTNVVFHMAPQVEPIILSRKPSTKERERGKFISKERHQPDVVCALYTVYKPIAKLYGKYITKRRARPIGPSLSI